MSCRDGNDCCLSCGGAAVASSWRNEQTLPPRSGHPRHCCSGQAAFLVRCLLSCPNSCCESGSCWSPVESLRSAWLRCSSPPQEQRKRHDGRLPQGRRHLEILEP